MQMRALDRPGNHATMDSSDADAASCATTLVTSDSASAGSCSATAGSSADDRAASSAAAFPGRPSPLLNLPPGYRFVPTDAELIVHFLRPRLAGRKLPLPVFVEARVLDYHPEQLIAKYRDHGEDRWFFFTERERKHADGRRPNRTTLDKGHWNATGSQRRIYGDDGALVGCVGTLVFYEASRKKKRKREDIVTAAEDMGKTEWTMYEYESLASEAEFRAKCNGEAKVDGLVLCTIQKKKKKKHRKQISMNEDEEVKSKRKRREKQLQDDQQIKKSNEMVPQEQEQELVEAPTLGAELVNTTHPNTGMLHYCSSITTVGSTTLLPTSSYYLAGDQMMLMPANGTQMISPSVHPNNVDVMHHDFSQPFLDLEALMLQGPPQQEYFPYGYGYGWDSYTQHMQLNTSVAPAPTPNHDGFNSDCNHLLGTNMDHLTISPAFQPPVLQPSCGVGGSSTSMPQGTLPRSAGNSYVDMKPDT